MDSFRSANRECKDKLFKFIFGNPDNKEWTLSLYNAVNGSAYTNPDDITLITIEDAVYMSMKNDVSFLIADCHWNRYSSLQKEFKIMEEKNYFSSLFEYDEPRTFSETRQDGYVEGLMETLNKLFAGSIENSLQHSFNKGREEGAIMAMVNLLRKEVINIEQAAECLNMTVAEFEKKTGLKA